MRVGDSHVFWTDCKCKMFFDNFLAVYARSGLGCKRGITPRNNVGIIDSDYYGNSDNDGNIGICLVNNGYEDLHVKVGDRIAQGIIGRYYITDDDKFASNNEKAVERTGGFGSSGK